MPPATRGARWVHRGPCRLRLSLQSGARLYVDVDAWKYRPEAAAEEWELIPADGAPDFAILEKVVLIEEVIR